MPGVTIEATGTHGGIGKRGWMDAAALAGVLTVLRVAVLVVLAAANGKPLGEQLVAWDAQHYLRIAAEGYAQEESFAFFPAFPLLLRVLGGSAAAGIALNVVLTVVMTAGVMALAQRMGAGRAGQLAAAAVVTSAPLTIVFTMPYTEALFGAVAFWALVALVDRRWLTAGAMICALGLVRLTAITLVAAFFVYVVWAARREWRAWVGVAISPLGLLGFLTWANAHLPRGYFALQRENWHSEFDMGIATARWVWNTLTTGDNVGYLLATCVIIATPMCLALAWRRLDLPVWLFAAALEANILLSDGLMHSRPRLLLPAALVLMPWAVRAVRSLRPAVAWTLVGAWALLGAWVSAYMLVVFEWAI